MKLFIFMALSLFLSSSLSVCASTDWNHSTNTLIAHNFKSSKKRPSFMLKADLTDEQLEILVDLRNSYEEETAKDKAMLRVEYRNLFNMITKPDSDKKRVLAIHQSLLDRKARLSSARINYFLESWSVLSEAQKKKLRRHVLERQLTSTRRRTRNHYSGNSSKKLSSSRGNEATKDKVTAQSSNAASSASTIPSAEEFLILLANQED